MTNTIPQLTPKPDHVPAHLVVDFDYVRPENLKELGVYRAVKRQLHSGPDIIWTPRHGGHWMVTRAEDVRFVQENYAIFSHEEFMIPRQLMVRKPIPLAVDPPIHARYRAVINPAFTPKAVARMREDARALTIELAEKMLPNGQCEFLAEFGRVMPVTMFLRMVDLPLDRREEFVEWGIAIISSYDLQSRIEANQRINDYLQTVLDEREGGEGDDLLTRVANWRRNPRFESDEETLSMASLLFVGGLDTVAASLSYITHYLATHPEKQQRLRDEPEIIGRVSEEFIRRFGLSNTGRILTQDFEYKGVLFKKDEMIMVPNNLSGIDERVWDDPLEVDFDREVKPGDHNTFGNGPHKCVGAPLARAEIQVFLEEFVGRMPMFRLDPDRTHVEHCGSVPGFDELYLRWD
ncbi:cytochrome P450 [Novosphingobium sp. ERN07]|uniref:cytochrome P450 n=1 Tax=Novosphingobium sp. ERN07 TaxID=2726187 RepID=UPI001456E42B|nr:cytochrome P450 [Novosphingobium sp. ERN07]NLR72779.1 cytochrome P450 [Novosphingobium sp. ERN07]